MKQSKIQRMPPNQQLLEQAAQKQPWTCCTKCEAETFVMVTRFKILSPLQVGGSEDVIVAGNCWACQLCGLVNERIPMMPPQGQGPKSRPGGLA